MQPAGGHAHWPSHALAGTSPTLPTLDDGMALDLLDEFGGAGTGDHLEPLPLSAAEAQYASAAPALPAGWPPPAPVAPPKHVSFFEPALRRGDDTARPSTAPSTAQTAPTFGAPPAAPSLGAAALAAAAGGGSGYPTAAVPGGHQHHHAHAPPPPNHRAAPWPAPPPRPATPGGGAAHRQGASTSCGAAAGPSTSSGWAPAASSHSGGGGGGDVEADGAPADTHDHAWWAAPGTGLRRALRAVRRPRGAGRDAPPPADAADGGPPSDDGAPPRPPRSMTRMLRTACAVFDFLRAGPQSEAAIRAALGNTQDVSKGLRRLLADRLVVRSGRGGRQSPFLYSISARGANTPHWAVAIPPAPTPVDELDTGGHYWDAGLSFNVW